MTVLPAWSFLTPFCGLWRTGSASPGCHAHWSARRTVSKPVSWPPPSLCASCSSLWALWLSSWAPSLLVETRLGRSRSGSGVGWIPCPHGQAAVCLLQLRPLLEGCNLPSSQTSPVKWSSAHSGHLPVMYPPLASFFAVSSFLESPQPPLPNYQHPHLCVMKMFVF